MFAKIIACYIIILMVENKKKNKSGIINPDKLRSFAFFIILISIFICAALCIVAIWGFAGNDVIWRSASTCLVVILSTIVIVMINEAFGDKYSL